MTAAGPAHCLLAANETSYLDRYQPVMPAVLRELVAQARDVNAAPDIRKNRRSIHPPTNQTKGYGQSL